MSNIWGGLWFVIGRLLLAIYQLLSPIGITPSQSCHLTSGEIINTCGQVQRISNRGDKSQTEVIDR